MTDNQLTAARLIQEATEDRIILGGSAPSEIDATLKFFEEEIIAALRGKMPDPPAGNGDTSGRKKLPGFMNSQRGFRPTLQW